jgi:hypothetical protein
MWNTPEGKRVLQGSEWELFRQGLSALWDWVEESFDDRGLCETGIAAFDELQPNQKLAILAFVGQAMHDAAMPAPALTAHVEGAAAAVFQRIRDSIGEEIELQDEPDMRDHATHWRDLALAAALETKTTGEEPLPDSRSKDLEDWNCLIDCLSDRVLWDTDYDMGGEFLDAAPQAGQAMMREMGIDPDYFLAVAPDPTEDQLDQIRRTLRQLTGRSEAG